MTESLVQTPISEVFATLEVLRVRGVTPGHLEQIRSDIGYANRIGAAFTNAPAIPPVSTDLTRLVPPPANMLATSQAFDSLVLGKKGFGREAFNALAPAPALPTGSFPVVVPVLRLDTLRQTVEFYIELMQKLYPGYWQWDALRLDAKSFRVWSPGGKQPDWPAHTLGWVGLDLLAYWDKVNGTCVRDNRAKENAPMPGVEILALAALAPALVQAMDGETMPYLDMPGIECTPSGCEAWSCASVVSWDRGGRRVDFSAFHVDFRCTGSASPAFRECRA